MDTVNVVLIFLTGVVLRLAIPIAITLAFIWALRRLDERWQAEAKPDTELVQVKNPGCWKINKCTPEMRARCNAYAHPETPCWQYFREQNHGHLQERCLGCKVFKEAPAPVYV
jgi:hypothetical protein